jgi:hypothetical protein
MHLQRNGQSGTGAGRGTMIDDAWQGNVQFFELVFGTWLAYAFLVIMWERALRHRLEEWRYVLITFLGASFYLINHYFLRAPFYVALINAYTVIFWVVYYFFAVRTQRGSLIWTIAATLSAVPFTVAFISFEQFARLVLEKYGVHEFWLMLMAYCGFLWLILWRGKASARPAATG